MRTTRSTITAAAGALLLLGPLVACGGGGGGSGDQVASLGTEAPSDDTTGGTAVEAPTDPEEAMLAYAECMRDHGIDIPDPQTDGDGRGVISLTVDPESTEFEDAQDACGPIMDAAVGEIERDPAEEAEMKEKMLAYSKCMREHGIDMPDPVFGEDGRVEMTGVEPVDFDSDEFQEATEACDRGDGGMVMSASPAGPGRSDDSEDGDDTDGPVGRVVIGGPTNASGGD